MLPARVLRSNIYIRIYAIYFLLLFEASTSYEKKMLKRKIRKKRMKMYEQHGETTATAIFYRALCTFSVCAEEESFSRLFFFDAQCFIFVVVSPSVSLSMLGIKKSIKCM